MHIIRTSKAPFIQSNANKAVYISSILLSIIGVLVPYTILGSAIGLVPVTLKYLDVIHALFCEVNPIPVKEAMNMMGMNIGGYRLPLYEMEESNKKRLHDALEQAGLL